MSRAPLAYPGVEGVVQKGVGQEWTDARTLGTSLIDGSPFTALENAGLEPSLNQANDPSVGSSVL
jgi:hypothetical protein